MIPFVGPSYHLDTREADVQRTVNMYLVMNEVEGGRTPRHLKSVPGLVTFSPDVVPTGPLWLDNFNGPEFTELTVHAQDVPLNGSVWEFLDPEFAVPSLSGTGAAWGAAFASVPDTKTITRFDDGAAAVLEWGWTLQVNFVHELISENDLVNRFAMDGEAGKYLTLQMNWDTFFLELDLSGSTFSVPIEFVGGGEPTPHNIVVEMGQLACIVTVNGSAVHTFTTGMFNQPLRAAIELSGEGQYSRRVDMVRMDGSKV